MTMQFDIFGHTYDDVEPAFANAGPDHVVHIKTGKLLSRAGLMDYGAARGYTFGENEIGTPSDELKALRRGIPYESADAGAAITVTADLAAQTITVAGGPADRVYQVDITYQANGDLTDRTLSETIEAGDTAAAAGLEISRLFKAGDELEANSDNGVVTLSLGTASSLDALSATAT